MKNLFMSNMKGKMPSDMSKSMGELTLHDLQQQGLKIMKVIDRWCVDHGVNYSLCGGSLIGAIRHKGFIPWDDDIDIMMARPEYDRFVREFKADGYVCIAPELGNSYIAYGRICDMADTLSEPYCPWSSIEGTGLWVDVFPFDGEPNDFDVFSDLVKRINNKINRIYQIRGARLPLSKKLGGVRIAKLIGKKILYGHCDLDKELAELLVLVKAIPFGETEYCGNLSFPHYDTKERSRIGIFNSYTRLPFEDTELQVVAAYEEYLRDVFGDYMQLPPEEERVPAHLEHKFFFK